MDYTKTIHEFLDGSLEINGEEEFFLMLANNEEFRSELKQQLAMKEAIKNDTKAYTPAAFSTMAIFSSLGFAPPSGVIQAKQGFGSKVKNFMAQYKQGFIGGIMSTAATIAVIFFLFNPMDNIAEKSLIIKGGNHSSLQSLGNNGEHRHQKSTQDITQIKS